jgi:MFS transporter, PAT family, beta-lactamase induction signal transducer AmpG
VNAAGSTRARLGLFAGLYFAQGVPWGFVTVALMVRLATLGTGPAALGQIGSIALLPWIGKPLVGLLVDRVSSARFGRRRPYVLAAEAGMALSLFALAFADPLADHARFAALLFAHNLFAVLQDVGTDALAIDVLPEHERGRANGFMTAGKFLGVLVGGQGLLTIASFFGWGAAYGAAIGLLLVPALLVLAVRESEPQRRSARLWRDLGRLFSRRAVWLAALVALVIDASDGLLFPLIYPLFTQRLHLSEQQIATLATITNGVAALAGIAGGALSDRLGRRRTIVAGSVAVALFDVVFLLAHGWWGSYAFLVVFTATAALATGVVYAATLAFFMDLTHPTLAATHFQVSMAMLNARSAWANRLGGSLAERLPARGMYGLAAIIELLPLALLPFVDARATKRSLHTDDNPA